MATSSTARRNRTIAIVAGVITAAAIVLAFASGYLGLSWLWLRPAAELLLLAELVGLIVLERHQLFEPVHESVGSIDANVTALRAELNSLSQRLDMSGQMTFHSNPTQTVGAIVRAFREAQAREQDAPQMLRWARLANVPRISSDPEQGAELLEMVKAHSAFGLSPGGAAASKNRMWSMRNIPAVINLESFEYWRENLLPLYADPKPLNLEIKLLLRLRSSPEALVTPTLVTDRDVILALVDDRSAFRWGFLFQGPQYVAVFARWFDELWGSIPESYLIYSRNGVDEKALDRIRKELEAAESADERRSA